MRDSSTMNRQQEAELPRSQIVELLRRQAQIVDGDGPSLLNALLEAPRLAYSFGALSSPGCSSLIDPNQAVTTALRTTAIFDGEMSAPACSIVISG